MHPPHSQSRDRAAESSKEPPQELFGHGVFVPAPGGTQERLRNYISSVAADSSRGIVAASAPKGGLVTYWDLSARRYLGVSDLNDGCGLAPTHHQANFPSPAGEGWLATADSSGALERQASSFQWDNHAILVR